MSSITTAIPTTPVTDWCIKALYDLSGNFNTCSQTTSAADYETICCDGWITDTTFDLYETYANGTLIQVATINPKDLMCCRNKGGDLLPVLQEHGTTCMAGTPTPLASLAATNIHNAQDYRVHYSSTISEMQVADYTLTQAPYCLWVNTAVSGVGLQTVTVSAAEIEKVPEPTTDGFGHSINTGMTAGATKSPVVTSPEASGASASSTSTKTSGGNLRVPWLEWSWLLGFVLTTQLFV